MVNVVSEPGDLSEIFSSANVAPLPASSDAAIAVALTSCFAGSCWIARIGLSPLGGCDWREWMGPSPARQRALRVAGFPAAGIARAVDRAGASRGVVVGLRLRAEPAVACTDAVPVGAAVGGAARAPREEGCGEGRRG